MSERAVVYSLKVGVEVYSRGNRLNENLSLESTVLGYKVIKDWDEERDKPDSSLKLRESKHCWEVFYHSTEGKLVGQMTMSTEWDVIKDHSDLPTGWKAEVQPPRPLPSLQVTVPTSFSLDKN